MKNRKNEIDMINGSLLKGILSFSTVVMITNVFQLLFNTADLIVVGKFAGNDALGAVGATIPLVNLFINMFIGFSVGITVTCSHCIGANNKKGYRETVGTSCILSLAAGIVLSALVIVFSRQALTLMGTPEELLDLSEIYIKIYFLSMPASLFLNYVGSAIRSVGNTKTPLVVLSFGGIINVILNLILVIVFKMSVAGVAIATTVSQYASAAFLIVHMVKTDADYRLTKDILRIFPDKLRETVRIGLPNCLYSVIIAVSNVLIQSSVNSLGAAAVAGSAAAANLESYVYQVQASFRQAAMTFVGQNLGAGKYERINKVRRISYVSVIIGCTVLGVAGYVFGRNLLMLFMKSGDNTDVAVHYGLIRMLFIMVPYLLNGINEVQIGVLAGLGQSLMPAVITASGYCGYRLIYLATVFPKFRSAEWLFGGCYPTSWLLTAIALAIYYAYLRKKHYPELKAKRPA